MAREGVQGVRIRLDIWHPDCRTLQMIAETNGDLLGHGVHEIDGLANGCSTAYADTVEEADNLLAAIHESPLTESVWETDDHDGDTGVPGSAARGIVIRYDLGNSINDAPVSRGFIPDEPVRMQGGRERWTVLVHETRQTVHERRGDLSGAKRRHRRGTHHRPRKRRRYVPDQHALRTPAQGVELTRRRGYYSWPCEVGAASLAAKLDIPKAALLEHLRRVESKLLGDY